MVPYDRGHTALQRGNIVDSNRLVPVRVSPFRHAACA